MGSIAVLLEQQGIPTVTVYNERHEKRFISTVINKGYIDYPAINFPEYEMFTAEGVKALAPQAFDFVVSGLTTWKPPFMQLEGEYWVPTEAEFTYTAATYQEALDQYKTAFLEMGWGDGLPLEPATRERVDALLKGTPLAPTTVLGTWGASNAEFTVEKVAIVAAMAGAKPEYMPVIIAALKAITSTKWNTYDTVMKSPTPFVVVNGPIAKEIGLNSSSNAFGPNPRYPANGSIGRAINLAMAMIPGNGRGINPSNLAGNPATYAGMVVAEAEEIMTLAPGWPPVSVQMGFKAGQNVVTVLGVDQMDFSVSGTIANLSSYVAPDKNIWPSSQAAWDARYAGALIITEMYMVTEGWMGGKTKDNFAQELWDLARFSIDRFTSLILTAEDGSAVAPNDFVKSLMENPEYIEKGMPVASGPNRFMVVVTGGA
jgi:hypothetical protein